MGNSSLVDLRVSEVAPICPLGRRNLGRTARQGRVNGSMDGPKDTPRAWQALLECQFKLQTLEQERDMLREATSKINIDRYRNDPQFLAIWLRYIQIERLSGRSYWELSDLFKFLKSARVGQTSTRFYKEWASFEVESDYPQKAIAILQSAIQMKIEPMKDLSDALLAIELRTKEPTETPHSQQTKTPPQTTEDKENAYPCQSIPRFKLGNRRALEVRAPPKPVTPNPQETIANINPCPIDPPSLTCHPAKSTPIQAADPNVHSNIETSLGSAPLASTKKKHHARMARLLQRPMLGPPSRQTRLNQTQSLLAAEIGSPVTDKVNKLALDAVESSPETRSVSQAPSTTQTPTPPHSSSPISISSSQISSTDLPEIENENDQTISATKVAKSEKLESNVTHKLSKLTGKDSTQTKIPSNQVQTAVAPTIKPVYQDYSVPLKSEERCYSKKEVIVNGITYQRMDLIGRGGSSKVFKIMDPRKGHIYALKKVKLRGEDSSVTEGYYNEIDLLRRLKGNRHIIQLVDYEACKDSLLVVLEYGEIDLAGILKRNQGQSLSLNSIKMYWEQMLNAVHAIHEENIIHSDLKPANFLLVEGSLRLIDFGIAKAIPNDTTNIRRDHQTGTINFMSPESIMFVDSHDTKLLKLGRASDVWSLGCILYQMLCGAPPFAHITPIVRKLQCIVNPEYHISFEPIKDQLGVESIQGCLDRNPKNRWSIPQLLRHDFLRLDANRVWLTEDIIIDILASGLADLLGPSHEPSPNDLRKIAQKQMARFSLPLTRSL